MFEGLGSQLIQNGLLPHGYCLTWSPPLLGANVLGDGLTALSYFSLPMAIGYFAWRRKDFPYPWVLWLFAAFIVSCGFTHLMGTIILWWPYYWLDATLKVITGIVSAMTAVLLWRLIPSALTVPGVDQFRAVNDELMQEIAERKRVEEDLKRANQELRELQERHFRQMVESMPQLVWTCRGDGPADYFSPQWVEYTGLAAEDCLGDGWLQAVHPDDRESTAQAWQAAVTGKRRYAADYRIRRHDGQYRWFSTRATPLFDQEGNISRWFGSNTDVHDMKVAQEALQAILENAPVLISFKDTEGRIVLANRAMFKRLPLPPEAEVIGRWLQEVLPGDASQRLWERDQEALLQDRPLEFEESLVHRDGSEHTYLALSFPVRDMQTKALTGVGCMLTDITERKAAEALVQQLNEELEERVKMRTVELEHSNEALVKNNIELQRFAYIASHDLQTPLRTIVGFSQILQGNLRDCLSEEDTAMMDRLIEATHRMHNLITDLLTYSRVDSQANPFLPVDFNEVLSSALLGLDQAIQETGAQLVFGSLPIVQGDRGQLTQLMQNLIENAIKYRSALPLRIEISAEWQGEQWKICVRDNGIGIDPRHFEKIFDIFQRLHSQHAYPGTGIGLAVCRRVVERHGGRIWVESEPGRGSTFCFTIPLWDDKMKSGRRKSDQH